MGRRRVDGVRGWVDTKAMRLASASHELAGFPSLADHHSHSLSWLAATCLAQEAHIARLLRPPRAPKKTQ